MYLISNAVVFPGQGSQYPLMLEDYFNNELHFHDLFVESSEILGIDLINLMTSGSEEDLSKTEITQPLMLVADLALWRLLSPIISEPTFLAGHSLGEYSALVASKVLTLKDALRLVSARSTLMQNAVPEGKGAIAAIIGLDETTVTEICNKISLKKGYLVNKANINSPLQLVISGTSLGVNKAIEECKKVGAKRAVHLNMSVPAHSELMISVSQEFSKIIEDVKFRNPTIPIIHNVDVSVSGSIKEIKIKLIEQIYKPVRWVETIQKISEKGVSTVIECGPNKVLTNLIKRIDQKLQVIDLDKYTNYLNLKNA